MKAEDIKEEGFLYISNLKNSLIELVKTEGVMLQTDLGLQPKKGEEETVELQMYRFVMYQFLNNLIATNQIQKLKVTEFKSKYNDDRFDEYSKNCIVLLIPNWERKEKIKKLLNIDGVL